jgi:hypothetical protein
MNLWIQKNFATPWASDLRKRLRADVDEIFFCETFIHSLGFGPVETGSVLWVGSLLFTLRW